MADDRQGAKPFDAPPFAKRRIPSSLVVYSSHMYGFSTFQVCVNMLPIPRVVHHGVHLESIFGRDGKRRGVAIPHHSFLVFLVLRGFYVTLRLVHPSLKWLLIGRRAPGNYPRDTSSYCFRWKLCDIMSDTSDLLLWAEANTCVAISFQRFQD